MARPGELISIGTMNPDGLQETIQARLHANPNDPVVPVLQQLLQSGETPSLDNQHIHTIAELNVDHRWLETLGTGAYDAWLMITVADSSGNPVTLTAAEYIAWQGLNPTAVQSHNLSPADGHYNPVAAESTVPVDQWAQHNNITLQSLAEEIAVGDQTIHIENPVGSRRIVSSGFGTGQYTLNYGSVTILDEDPDGPPEWRHRPIFVGKDGEQDINATAAVIAAMRQGEPYRGPVVIKSRDEEGRSDPKEFWGVSTPQEAIVMEDQNFTGPTTTVTELDGITFDQPIALHSSFIAYNDGTPDRPKHHPVYFALSHSETNVYHLAEGENTGLRNYPPEKWIENTFGSLQNFNALMQPYGQNDVSRAQYHDIMAQNFAMQQAQHWDNLGQSGLMAIQPVTRTIDGHPVHAISGQDLVARINGYFDNATFEQLTRLHTPISNLSFMDQNDTPNPQVAAFLQVHPEALQHLTDYAQHCVTMAYAGEQLDHSLRQAGMSQAEALHVRSEIRDHVADRFTDEGPGLEGFDPAAIVHQVAPHGLPAPQSERQPDPPHALGDAPPAPAPQNGQAAPAQSQYWHDIAANPNARVVYDAVMHRDPQPDNELGIVRNRQVADIVEHYEHAAGIEVENSDNHSKQGDHILGTNEMGAIFGLAQKDPAKFQEMVQALQQAGVQIATPDANNHALPQNAQNVGGPTPT